VVNTCENYWSQYLTLVRQDKQLSSVQNGWHQSLHLPIILTSHLILNNMWCWKGLYHKSRYKSFSDCSGINDINKLEGLVEWITNQYFSKSNLFWLSITCALSFRDHIKLIWKIIPWSFICLYLRRLRSIILIFKLQSFL
jgi:hypothetical protein